MTLRRPTTIAFRLLLASVAIALIVAAALIVLVLAISGLRRAIDREGDARDTLTAVLRLENATANVESALRGYLITSNQRFLEPWQASLRDLKPAQQRLEKMTASDPKIRTQVQLLDDGIAAYVRDYARPLIAIAKIDPRVARSSIAATEGKRRTDLLRSRFDRLQTLENTQTAQRTAAVSHAASVATTAAIAAIVVCALLIVGLGALGARALHRRLKHAAAAASEIAGGEFSTRLPEVGAVELAELGRAFNTMAQALEESRETLLEQNRQLQENERRKTELITVVSHELRTPLSGLLGFTTLLLERDFDEETTRRYLTVVHAASRRLSALVERFLDVSRVEDASFELRLEQVDVVPLLREQSELLLADSIRHTLVLNLPREQLPVLADRERLGEVIGNLISNAVLYSPDGGAVEVAARRAGPVLRLEVTDHGLGIPDADQPRVFTKFFRGRAAERGIPGTGLGLAVAREIVEAHGGRIGFASTSGRGSTFWIELPYAPAAHRAPPATAA